MESVIGLGRNTHLQELTGWSLASAVLWGLVTTCAGVALVSLMWELFLRNTWLDVVRESLTEALVDPTVKIPDTKRRREASLKRLLCAAHGSQLGDAIYRTRDNNALNERQMKRDFMYNITLSALDEDPRFHRASFYLEFTVDALHDDPSLEFVKLGDSMDFHRRYRDLVSSSPGALYRYILLSEHVFELKDFFSVRECTITSDASGETVDLESTPRTAKDRHVVDLKVSHDVEDDMKAWQDLEDRFLRIKRGKCTVKLAIATVVDAQRNEFPILLGYPVQGFSSRLDARDIGASKVDALDFFTAPTRFKREVAGDNNKCQEAAGHLDDVILPDSGLVYVWR